MKSFYDEFLPSLIFLAVLFTALMVNKLRQEIRELREILQQRPASEPDVVKQSSGQPTSK